MKNAKTLTAMLCVAALLPTAGFARADDTAPNRREGMRRFKEGMAAYGKGDFEQARLSLLQAYAVVPDAPNLAWNVALAEQKAHHNVDALKHFRIYLRSPSLTDKERAQAQKHLDAVSHETGHIAVSAEPGTQVTLDGTLVHDTLTDPLDTEPGSHVLEAKRGAQSKTLSVAPQPGETVTADLRLVDETSAPPAPVPPVVAPPAEGASPEPFASVGTASPETSTGPSQVTRIVVTSALGAGAVTSIILGIVFTGQASNDGALGHSLKGPCAAGQPGTCDQGHQAAEDQATEKNVATGLYIGGGVLAGAAVASWFLLAPKTSSSAGAMIVPQVSPTSASCVLSGRF